MAKIIRGYEKQILLKNAYQSWIQAIKNARDIKNGLVTLQYKKSFISTLHNAVELFLKQLMLNTQDYRVAKVKPTKLNKNGEPLKSYYQSQNLNEYFKNLTVEERKIYISIEFSELISIHKELLRNSLPSGSVYTTELQLLQRLRNDETHFYVDADEFLDSDEFILLHNFMISFNKILENEHLLPCTTMPIAEEQLLCFDDTPLDKAHFSFDNSVKNSPKVKVISKIINGECFKNFTPPYELAECFEDKFLENGISFDEAYSYIESMLDYDIINYIEEYGEIEDECGKIHTDILGYKILSNL